MLIQFKIFSIFPYKLFIDPLATYWCCLTFKQLGIFLFLISSLIPLCKKNIFSMPSCPLNVLYSL